MTRMGRLRISADAAESDWIETCLESKAVGDQAKLAPLTTSHFPLASENSIWSIESLPRMSPERPSIFICWPAGAIDSILASIQLSPAEVLRKSRAAIRSVNTSPKHNSPTNSFFGHLDVDFSDSSVRCICVLKAPIKKPAR